MHSHLRSLFALLVLVFAAHHPFDVVAQGGDAAPLPPGFQTRELVDETGSHRYLVFTPAQYDPSQKWPVLLFLHGAGERGQDTPILLAARLAVALEQKPDLPFIAVFPQCEDRQGRALTGWSAASPDATRALKILNDVEADFSVDPQRRMLAGWSMGGYGAWSLAATFPEMWSSVLVLAGGAIDDALPLQGLVQRKTPVWAISASSDPLIPFSRSEKLVQTLNEQGGNGHFTLLNSDDHDVSRTVFASPEVFKWMLNPESVAPRQVDFSTVTPLPSRTKFYDQHLVEPFVIADSLAMRLGNAPFHELARELPELLSSVPLTGQIDDIVKTVGRTGNEMTVRLSDIHFHCAVTRIWAHGISGGRLGLEVDFQPLELTIGRTTLDSTQHQARTGPIHIRIGVHKPAVLKLEVQPVIEQDGLQLRLLRTRFDFDNGNWYIQPPTDVEARSDRFTPDQLVTGIVGSLYEGKSELLDGILNVIPDLIKRAEDELKMREAPQLARLLSPLPVLVPDLRISPSFVRTDRDGVSVLCDMNVAVRHLPQQPDRKLPSLHPSDIATGDQLEIEVMLDAVNAVSQLTVDQGQAQVNVLDISEEQFARFAQPTTLNELFPELKAASEDRFSTVLRLVEPMTVIKSPHESAEGHVGIQLVSSLVALDVYRATPQESAASAVGTILFALNQPITIKLPHREDASQTTMKLDWVDDCDVSFLRAAALHSDHVPQVNAERFEANFKEAWLAWGQANGSQEIPLTVLKVGKSSLRINALRVTDQTLDLQLRTGNTPATSNAD